MQRACRAEIVAYAFVVDAKDAEAAAFYAHHGLQTFPDSAVTLFLPQASVISLVDFAKS